MLLLKTMKMNHYENAVYIIRKLNYFSLTQKNKRLHDNLLFVTKSNNKTFGAVGMSDNDLAEKTPVTLER